VVNSVPQTPWLNFLGEERKVKMEGKWKGGRKRRSGREKEGSKKEGDKGRGRRKRKGGILCSVIFPGKILMCRRENAHLYLFLHFFSLLKN